MKSRLSKHVFLFFTGEKETVGFTGSFRPIRIRIKKRIALLPGWYLINKRPKNKIIKIDNYASLKYLDYNDVYIYRKRLLIRYTKLTNQYERGKKLGFLRVADLKSLWNYMVGDRIYVLVLGNRSMFMFMGNYEFLAFYYYRFFRYNFGRGKMLVSNDRDLKVSLVIVDSRRVNIPFEDFFTLRYEQWNFLRSFYLVVLMRAVLFGDMLEEDTAAYKTLKKLKRIAGVQ